MPEILINGESRSVPDRCSVKDLLADMGLDVQPVAVEVNHEIVHKRAWSDRRVRSGDAIEIVHFVGGGSAPEEDRLSLAGRDFGSRLIVGTGKYADFEVMRQAHEASGAEIVTVAVRRVDWSDRSSGAMMSFIDRDRMMLLPNTAGCYNAEDAIRYARLGRELGLSEFVKLEVIGDEKTLFPDNEQLLEATRVLVKEGFKVLPYTNDDPVTCRKLQDAGAAAVMPLGAPIGSGLGIQNPNNIRLIVEASSVPVIVDAGVGTASDAAFAMELGADGVLMNTGIAGARDPIAMATAMRLAVEAGRLACRAGRIPRRRYATASTTSEGMLETAPAR